MTIGFRAATADDALCIGILGTQVFLDTYAPAGIRPAIAREVRAHFSLDVIEGLLTDPSIAFILAVQEEHLLGFAQVTVGATHPLVLSAPSAELDRLYVQEPFTSRGLGKALLQKSQQAALARGAACLWLTAWVGNSRALAFYARQGYTELGSTLYTFENEDFENRVFARDLAAPGG